MGVFKNKREEKECYIEKRILDAKELSDSELQREIYLKELYLIELREGVNKSISAILIPIFLTISTIIMSWVTLSNSFISNSMTATKAIIDLKIIDDEEKTLVDEEKREIKDIFSELLDYNRKIVVTAITFTTIIILISLGSFLICEFLRNKDNKKKGLAEIELNILREELNFRKENIKIKNKHLNEFITKEAAMDNVINS